MPARRGGRIRVCLADCLRPPRRVLGRGHPCAILRLTAPFEPRPERPWPSGMALLPVPGAGNEVTECSQCLAAHRRGRTWQSEIASFPVLSSFASSVPTRGRHVRSVLVVRRKADRRISQSLEPGAERTFQAVLCLGNLIHPPNRLSALRSSPHPGNRILATTADCSGLPGQNVDAPTRPLSHALLAIIRKLVAIEPLSSDGNIKR